MQRMLGMRGLPPANLRGLELQGLSIEVRAEVLAAFEQMRQRIEQHEIEAAEREAALAERTALLQRKDRDLALRDAKIEKLEFEIARYKRWKFAAKTEAMSAEQRRLFEETVVEDEAGLQAQLAALRAGLPETPKRASVPRAKPRRQALPEHLERVEHHHEPADTACPRPECGQPMQRIGEDVSEKLDIVPARSSCIATSTASGRAAAASALRRSRPSPTWSTAASRPAAGGPHADQPLRRSPAVLPAERHQRQKRRAHAALDAGQPGPAPAVRHLQPLYERTSASSSVPGAARRRDAAAAAGPGRGQDQEGLHLGLGAQHHDPNPGVVYEFCLGAGRSTRWPSSAARGPPSRAVGGHAAHRPVRGYNGVLDTPRSTRSARQRLRGACTAQVRGAQPRRHSASAWPPRRCSAGRGSTTSKRPSPRWRPKSACGRQR
jgi:transposase